MIILFIVFALLCVVFFVADYNIKLTNLKAKKIDIFNGYVKLKDIEEYIKKDYFEKLKNGKRTERLENSKMIQIDSIDFAGQKIVSEDSIRYIVTDDYYYENARIYTKAQHNKIENLVKIMVAAFATVPILFVLCLFLIGLES